MAKGNVREGASQQLCFVFPTFYLAQVKVTLAIHPVNDDFGVANDLKVIKGPSGSKQKGRPKSKQLSLSIRAPSTAKKPLCRPLLMRLEYASRTALGISDLKDAFLLDACF
jgi:hypothetical protein